MPTVPIGQLLEHMIKVDAADLYLSVGAPPKFSLQGNFVTAVEGVLTPDDTANYAQQLLPEDQYSEFCNEMEMNTSYTHGADGRFRVNCFIQRGSTSIVIRRIKVHIPTFKELGLPPILGNLITQDRGLLLVTGATGSGKSTTLASMIDQRNAQMGGHIITIEDPVEFVFLNRQSVISQREVGIDTKSFHDALKNTLRQAPKVIYIGEIRDTDTMSFALHAAETGHLVLATLHSTNASQTLERIIHFFPNDYRPQLLLGLSLNLRAIISQRLVRREPKGRIPALEILINTPYISELILKGEINQLRAAMGASSGEGLCTFDQSLHALWSNGLITEDEALRNADSGNNLRLKMRGIG
jgi:twitching motility protein PilU